MVISFATSKESSDCTEETALDSVLRSFHFRVDVRLVVGDVASSDVEKLGSGRDALHLRKRVDQLELL